MSQVIRFKKWRQ